MTVADMQAQQPAEINTFVSSDMMALASHMNDCERSHGSWLPLVSAFQWVKAMAFSRIVTTGAVLGVTALCLLLALA